MAPSAPQHSRSNSPSCSRSLPPLFVFWLRQNTSMIVWPAAIAAAASCEMILESAQMSQKPRSALATDTFFSFVMWSAQCPFHTS